MEKELDYTFVLEPGQKTRFSAGTYDDKQRRPRYAIKVSVVPQARNQIEINQFLLKTGDDYSWSWDIKNDSSWPAFFIVTVDGKLLRQ